MDEAAWRGGLAEHYDYMLTEKPDDPNMRESASVWVYEENGEFAFPRNGIEGVGAVWENHRYDCNFAFADGRALFETRMDGKTHSPVGPDGRATILGSGGLVFQCIEPYRRWRVSYEGNPVDTTVEAIIAGTVDPARTTPLRYELDLTMVTPAWVQDNTPEALARMSERERTDAGLMGFGYRMEHLFRATGTLWIDGMERRLTRSAIASIARACGRSTPSGGTAGRRRCSPMAALLVTSPIRPPRMDRPTTRDTSGKMANGIRPSPRRSPGLAN
jgi:hypothetical protein